MLWLQMLPYCSGRLVLEQLSEDFPLEVVERDSYMYNFSSCPMMAAVDQLMIRMLITQKTSAES